MMRVHRLAHALLLALVLLAGLSACGKYAPPRRAPDATRPPPLEAVEAGPAAACEDPETRP